MKPRVWVDETPAKPIRSFVPSGEVEAERPGWRIRVRGVGGDVATEYCCPVHGKFTAMVPRASVPDAVNCPAVDSLVRHNDESEWHNVLCGAPSPWSPSTVGIGWAAGEVTC